MKSTMRCLVLFGACSLWSACSGDETEKHVPKTMDKPLATARSAADSLHEKALTAAAPTTLTSIALTHDKKAESAPPAGGDPEKRPKLEGVTADDAKGEPIAEQATPEIDFDRPLDPAEVSIKRFVLATDVKNREPIGESDVFMTDTSKIFAFVELSNEGAPYAVRVHWEKVDEKPSPYGVKLDVKSGPRFRTWAWTAIKREPGQYKAVLRTLDGKDIASREFTLHPGEDCGFEHE